MIAILVGMTFGFITCIACFRIGHKIGWIKGYNQYLDEKTNGVTIEGDVTELASIKVYG